MPKGPIRPKTRAILASKQAQVAVHIDTGKFDPNMNKKRRAKSNTAASGIIPAGSQVKFVRTRPKR